MRLLVLGGTVFLSRAVARAGLDRGHAVVCAARGRSGAVPDGAELVPWDRADPVPAPLRGQHFDAVVDVARVPSHVRSAVEAFPGAHWVFVSTISVYTDDATPGGGPGTLPIHEPRPDDLDPAEHPEAYGALKVACEDAVRAGTASAAILRPGLIAGPGDPSGRFAYWPERIARGGDVLAPGSPVDTAQIIDVRDLATWIVEVAETRWTGTADAVGPVQPLGALLDEIAGVIGGPNLTFTWVPGEVLGAHGVQPWSGPESVPLWLPRPDYDGMLAHDPRPAARAGLRPRPVAETARDVLAWTRSDAAAPITGIGRDREKQLLAEWHAAQARTDSAPPADPEASASSGAAVRRLSGGGGRVTP